MGGLALGWPLAVASVQLAGSSTPLTDWRSGRAAPHHRLRVVGCGISTGALFGVAAWRWREAWTLGPHLALFALLVVVCAIDVEHYRIPDRITFPAMAATAGLVAVDAAAGGSVGPAVRAAAGAFLLWGGLGLAHLISPRGMGRGDVKLGVTLGAFLGWAASDGAGVVSLVLGAVFAASVIGTAVGVAVLAVRRRSAPYPFGPALAAGTVIALVVSGGPAG